MGGEANVIRIILIVRDVHILGNQWLFNRGIYPLSTIDRNLVGREELRRSRHAGLLGEKGEQAVADLELLDHGTEAAMIVSNQNNSGKMKSREELTHSSESCPTSSSSTSRCP